MAYLGIGPLGQIGGTSIGGSHISPIPGGKSGSARAAQIEVLGVGALIAKLEKAKLSVRREVGKLMSDEMKGVIKLSQDKYIPRDTGAAADSGFVKGPMFTQSSVAVEAGFGPSAKNRNWRVRSGRGSWAVSGSEYVVPLHEMSNLAHQFGSWKYLLIPFMEKLQGMEDRISSRLVDNLFGGAAEKMFSGSGFGAPDVDYGGMGAF